MINKEIEQRKYILRITYIMRRMFSIMFLVFLLFTICGCNIRNSEASDLLSKTDNQLTQKEKEDDFEYMYKILKENYPFFDVNKRINGIDWLSNKDKYINKVKATKSDVDFYKTLNAILKELHNGHTEIFNIQDYMYFKKLYNQDIPWANQLNNNKAMSRYNKGNSYESSVVSPSSNEKIYENSIKAINTESKNNNISENNNSNNVKTKILSKGCIY